MTADNEYPKASSKYTGHAHGVDNVSFPRLINSCML